MDREELQKRFKSGERNFSGVDWSDSSLHTLNLTGIILVGANLSRCVLSDTMFDNANLEGAYFKGANLDGARFQNANLCRANFDSSILIRASFYECNADEASFRNTDIRMADFKETTLRTTNWADVADEGDNLFIDVDFTGSEYTPNVWDDAVRVILPDGEIYTTPRLEGRNW